MRDASGIPTIPMSALGRAAQLEAMASGPPLDVLVVGGGITGVGIAMDAASRGLRVGIVERDDWACGTSSRSSKMIHGGLRYLATGDVGVVRDSLRERSRLQRNAAHLVRPLPMLLPAYGRGVVPWQRARLASGLWTYEALGHRKAAGSLHRWVDVPELTRLVPNVGLRSRAGGGALRGAYGYHDGSADDVRLVLATLRTAVALGAFAVNGVPMLRLLRDGDRVCGAVVGGDVAAGVRGARGGELELEARVVVNATGVWADATVADADGTGAGFRIMPSKGIHLTVARDRAGIASGIAFFEQMGNANVFIEPWQDDLAIVGTTDAPYTGDLRTPDVRAEEIDWLLGTVNQFIRDPLTPSDVIASWAGLRPLIAPEHDAPDKSRDVSRRHMLVDRPGLVTITGGKLTAYRSMAELAVDAVARQIGHRRESGTRDLRLDGWRDPAGPGEIGDLAARMRIDRGQVRQLLRRHGANVAAIADLVDQDPDLADRVHPARPYIAAEVVWAARHEQARTPADVLDRRLRIGLETADPGTATAFVSDLLRAEADLAPSR